VIRRRRRRKIRNNEHDIIDDGVSRDDPVARYWEEMWLQVFCTLEDSDA
jgi:hypothetical protein